MLSGLQQYLVDKGFKRTCTKSYSKEEVEDYESLVLSTYSPLCYNFTKDGRSCYWGLSEYKKQPVMFLGRDKMIVNQTREQFFDRKTNRTTEDGYRLLF
jgi:hypothetical protein